MQPLRTHAKQLSSEPSMRRSAPSKPDIDTLAERFVEPLRGENPSAESRPAMPAPAVDPRASGLPVPQAGANARPRPPKAPLARGKLGLSRNALIAALAALALIPLAILIVQLWPDTTRPHADGGPPPAETPAAGETSPSAVAQADPGPPQLEVVLSTPDRIDANTGDFVAFPIAIDATGPLPPFSIVSVSALPEGASFSEGRPFGADGWNLRPDEIAGLRLRLPAKSGASDLRLEFVAGDGTVLSQSQTALSITPPTVATVDAAGSAPAEESASAERTGSVAVLAPRPPRKPPAANKPDVKVNTVKTVAIEPPGEKKPYDGAYALGSPADGPGEWMETKTAVDMHAKAEQSSDTVKVAQGGIKVQVKARDNRWVQVHDPKSGTTGWIYDRFLKEAEAD